MHPIDELFGRLRRDGHKAFIPFLPAGDPDTAATTRLLGELAAAGAHLIEVGFPFSDPIADGPVIQASYTRALERGVRLDAVFEAIRAANAMPAVAAVPLVGMVSYSLIFRRGPSAFLDAARNAGLSGLIVPDLPPEEAGDLAPLAAERGLKLVMLVTPTTSEERAKRVLAASGGFVYCVSVAGITGERDRLPDALLDQLRWLRTQTELPLCVGFGVSRPEHARTLRGVADGIIVGSALVRRLERAATEPLDAVAADIRAFVTSLVAALNPPD
jgi:tryptophan synthase alpha chain